MRAWIATLTVLAAGMLLTTGVLADDADDIKALEIDSRAQEMAGNVDGYFQYKGSGYTIFPPTGGFLSPGSTKESALLKAAVLLGGIRPGPLCLSVAVRPSDRAEGAAVGAGL